MALGHSEMTPGSLGVCACPSAAEYLGWMTKVSVAVADSIAPRNIPQLDYDEASRLVNSFLQANPSPGDDGWCLARSPSLWEAAHDGQGFSTVGGLPALL